MRTHKLAFIDTETTGLMPDKHELIEIGLVLAEQSLTPENKIALRVIDEFDVKIKPVHIETADMESLSVNHYKEEDWISAVSLEEALSVFSDKTADAIMVGHNVAHDFAFLQRAFTETGVQNKMHYHKLDTISVAFAKLYSHMEIEKLSLRALCEYLGVENKNSHTALSDARATFQVFKKMMEL
ncbi:MAG: 3'-5' exonuclease [Candidatus Paceibacterota bacterium]|jgi:DNA polymerase III epsilon subunit-like protein